MYASKKVQIFLAYCLFVLLVLMNVEGEILRKAKRIYSPAYIVEMPVSIYRKPWP